MHIEVGQLNHLARAVEGVLAVVVTQHVADILAEEAFDALSELLDTVHVDLLNYERRWRVGVHAISFQRPKRVPLRC